MSKHNKENEEVKVEFLGNSAIDVTQSAVMITFMDKQYLLECGSVQGYSVDKCFTLNSQLIQSINVENLEMIFALHVHQDHIGNIPALTKKPNFHAKIACTKETMELGRLMWLDAAYISEKDAETLSKKKNGKVTPIFKDSDVYRVYNYIQPYELGVTYEINEHVSFKFLKNSHCLGACQLELYFRTPSNRVKKITYTSDIGSSMKYKWFVNDMEYSIKNNLLILEGTYGKKSRSYTKQDVIDERKDIKETIKDIIKYGGRVLMPTFSFSRTQEVLVDLYNMFKDDDEFGDTPVFIDSKLSVDITACYKKILDGENLELMKEVTSWENVKMNKDIKATMANLAEGKPCVVLSSQGFLEAGRSQLYAKEFLSDPNDAILFVGYCPENSVGGRILNENTKTVKIGDKVCAKKCLIKRYRTYSSHAQHHELINYIKQVNTERVIIHHAAPDAKAELIEDAINELSKINKTTKVIGSQRGMTIIV